MAEAASTRSRPLFVLTGRGRAGVPEEPLQESRMAPGAPGRPVHPPHDGSIGQGRQGPYTAPRCPPEWRAISQDTEASLRPSRSEPFRCSGWVDDALVHEKDSIQMGTRLF